MITLVAVIRRVCCECRLGCLYELVATCFGEEHAYQLVSPAPPRTQIDVKVGGTSLIMGSKATLDRADIRVQSGGPSGIVKFTPDGYEATLLKGSDEAQRGRGRNHHAIEASNIV